MHLLAQMLAKSPPQLGSNIINAKPLIQEDYNNYYDSDIVSDIGNG